MGEELDPLHGVREWLHETIPQDNFSSNGKVFYVILIYSIYNIPHIRVDLTLCERDIVYNRYSKYHLTLERVHEVLLLPVKNSQMTLKDCVMVCLNGGWVENRKKKIRMI